MIDSDSNPEVRRAVLSCIVPSAKTLSKIVARTKDVKEAVRKLAYQVNKFNIFCRHILKRQKALFLKYLEKYLANNNDIFLYFLNIFY